MRESEGVNKPVKRTALLRMSLTPLEKKVIERKAKNAGMQAAPYCRTVCLGHQISGRLTEEEIQAYQMLVKYHNNFQRITNLLKSKDSAFAGEVLAAAREIKAHLEKFK